MTVFDVQDLFYSQFGYVGRKIELTDGSIGREVVRRTLLGTELIMPMDIAMPGVTIEAGDGVDVETINGETYWQLQLEPTVSVKGGNILKRRYTDTPSETGGSIKERWSDDDFSVTIRGFLANLTGGAYPEVQVRQLKEFKTFKKSILVRHKLLNLLGIERLAIKDLELPHTDGENYQAYSINAYSDVLFDSLLEEV